jgi:LPS export ABC transporter protein LptC
MQAFRQDKAPLNVKANTAHISNDGDHVLLTGAVDIDQEKRGDDDSLSIKTEKLFLDNSRDYLETNKAITIKTSKHVMQGVGMQAWLEHKKYRLFSNVRGKHEP